VIYGSLMRKKSRAIRSWAQAEFGRADLGDVRRGERLVKMAGDAVVAPAGRITEVFDEGAEREAAYRFLENDAVEAQRIVEAAVTACSDRLSSPYVVVPIDQTSLALPSATGDDNFGPIGTTETTSRGMEAMSAIAVDAQGVLLGVAGQKLFVRRPAIGGQSRPFEEKETRYWLDVMEATRTGFAHQSTRPWFQLDRGGDFKEALRWADFHDAWVTVRAHHDRKVVAPQEGLLWEVMMDTEALGHIELEVRARPGKRKARTAQLEIRTSPLLFPLKDAWSKKTGPVVTFAVHAIEVSDVPKGEEPVEWMLLVNRAVETLDVAREVLSAYTQRWKIEEVHRVWKTTCTVERSNLRSPDSFAIWATILFCVAVRVERLKRLSRAQPHLPASVELSHWEIQALLLLKDKKGFRAGRMPTISEVVLWLAQLGGYTGKSSGGPPGAQTIGRGIQNIALAAEAVRELKK
jgi:hypothetical protein